MKINYKGMDVNEELIIKTNDTLTIMINDMFKKYKNRIEELEQLLLEKDMKINELECYTEDLMSNLDMLTEEILDLTRGEE